MITQHAQGPGSTAGVFFFFLRNKMRKERMRERKEGEWIFERNALAFEVGRWAVEEWDISHLSHSSQEGHSTANIQNAAACFCNMNFWIVPPANTSRTWVWYDSPGQTDLVFGCVKEMTCGVAVWPYGSSMVLRIRRACFLFQPTVLGCALCTFNSSSLYCEAETKSWGCHEVKTRVHTQNI